MKSGSTEIVLIECDVDIDLVSSVIFTFKSGDKSVTKRYPSEVTYTEESKLFAVPMYQSDTITLTNEKDSAVYVEGQINFTDKSVAKTDVRVFTMRKTLATELVNGNTPSATALANLKFNIVDNVIVAKAQGGEGGTSNYNNLENKPKINGTVLTGNKSLDDLGINAAIAGYVTEHKAELKGDKGDKGNDGNDYVITSNDYNAIANVVIGLLDVAESEEF